jgi:hypothetical protein
MAKGRLDDQPELEDRRARRRYFACLTFDQIRSHRHLVLPDLTFPGSRRLAVESLALP